MISNDDILDLLSEAVHSGQGAWIPVAGRSMGPAFAAVSDIRVVSCEVGCISPGTLVVFQRDGRWVVHRVMRRLEDGAGAGYLTKGDGLAQPDRPMVRPHEIKGMVIGLGLRNGARIDLLSLWAKFRAWLIIARWKIRVSIGRIGRDPKLSHRA